MKKVMMFLALMIGLVSCGSGDNTSNTKNPEKNRVEVVYFHGKQRCATCMAIEKNAKEVVNTMFSNEVKNGTVVFKTVDISTPEGKRMADQYEVTWSSLFVNRWKDGKETRNNMTEFGFANARKNPDGFKKGIEKKVYEYLYTTP